MAGEDYEGLVGRVDRLEIGQQKLEEGQQTLLAGQARMEPILETLASNQKGVFSRLNRPWQWSVVASILIGMVMMAGTFATVLVLVTNPIQKDVDNLRSDHKTVEERLNEVERQAAVSERDRYWLEKMADRNNDQIDLLWIELKRHLLDSRNE